MTQKDTIENALKSLKNIKESDIDKAIKDFAEAEAKYDDPIKTRLVKVKHPKPR